MTGLAVVTGASSGIGAALARGLARQGHALLLVARSADRLERVAEEIRRESQVDADVHECDLAECAQRTRLATDLRSRPVSVLCANAGFPTCGPLADADPVSEAAQVKVNVIAMHELVLAVLPGMLAQRSGSILVTGSTAGDQPVPTAATYSASKAFANTFAQALGVELRGTGVTCTLLAPGPVRTGFTTAGGITAAESHAWFGWRTADRVASAALRGVARGQRVVVPGSLAKVQALAGRLLPRALVYALLRNAILPRLRSGG